MLIQTSVGQPANSSITSGATPTVRGGQLGDVIVSELQGRFYEQVYRNNTFSYGMSVTALSTATITTSASTTPIIGVWNPSTSPVNLVILQAGLQIAVAGNSAVAPGGFVWATSIGNASITTGNKPLNRKTLSNTGSNALAFNISTALTGLTNALTIQEAADFGTLVAAQGATASALIGPQGVQNFDGSLIIPPGGVLALLNTVSTTTVSVASRLLWAEVPV